jgi:hypothetical protein
MNAFKFLPNRREVVRSLVGGSLLLPGILSELLQGGARADDSPAAGPLAPKPPHFPAKAKRVIVLFSTGGVSHMDTFDHKPELFKADGKKTGIGGGLSNQQRVLLRPKWDFKPGGKCGTLVSDLFPHIRECMDDICLIRSMKSDDNEHYQATLAIHTGSFFFSRPSLGSWVSYGLGTENQNLPSFIVLAPHLPYAGTQVYANDFLPAYHQGTRVVPGAEPIPDLRPRTKAAGLQELELGLAAELNRRHLRDRGTASELAARMQSFDTAFHMQTEAPEAFDLSQEPDSTLEMYGLERGQTDSFAWQCLIARRLAQRGVRFVELIDSGSSGNWDSHGNMADHGPLAKKIDQPIAALLKDLKREGMLDDTLVIWTTEFGRTPGVDGDQGRGHHSACFSSWLAGGGVKGGMIYGETDEIGATVVRDRVHVHDFHATILHLLGFDHTRLTFRHAGRDYRMTDVHGRVVKEVMA